MLGGERLYVDLIDLNPPFIFWLSYPAAFLSGTGLDPTAVFRVLVLAILGAMLLLAIPLTRNTPAIRAGYVIFAFTLPLGHFAEREHLIFGLMLPYVALAVLRADGLAVRRGMAAAVGVAAGAAVALKPPVLLAPAALTLYVCLRDKSIKPLFYPENLVAGGTLGVAFASILVLAPAYLEAIRQYGALYAQFSRGTLPQLMARDLYSLSVWLAVIIALVTLSSLPNRRTVAILVLASLGFLAAAVAQGKGFGYHYFPAMGFAVITLLHLVAAPLPPSKPLGGFARRTVAAAALTLILILPSAVALDRIAGRAGTGFPENRELASALEWVSGGTRVAVISVRLADAFPWILDERLEHVLSSPSMWFTGLNGPVARAMWQRTASDIERRPPEILVVRAPSLQERNRGDMDVDYLALLCAEDEARRALKQYGHFAHVAGYDLYRPQFVGPRPCRSA
jgi:hypothetical protein